MRRNLSSSLVFGLVAACVAILGCDSSAPSAPVDAGTGTGTSAKPSGGGSGESLSGKIEIDGSSTVYKLTQAVAQEFNKANSGVAMKVDKSGTGGGFKKFVLGSLDICDASRPIQQKEIDDCKKNNVEYIELPIAFDALTVAVNAENDWCTSLTTDELKKMWEPAPEGQPHPVMSWKDIRPDWPDQKISLFGADRESGTFEYFTEAIVEKKNSSRDDCSQLADDNAIVLGVAGDKFALGYVPYAYYVPRTDKLKAVAIDSSKDEAGPVLPSVEAVKASTYKPLARPLFIYVNRKAAERPEIKGFVEFYLKNGASMSARVKYIPLTDAAYTKGTEQFAKLQIGTRFGGGHAVTGQPLDHIMDQEPQP